MKFILCALSLFVFTSTALAEETIRKEGDKSLNFSFARSELQRYKYGFGGKYWTSSDIAFAASIDISRNETDSNDSSGGTSTSASSEYSDYSLSFAIEKHLQTSSRLSPYFGGELQYTRYRDEYSSDYGSSSYHDEMLGKRYGVAALAGAEYALNKNISLAGEYAYGFNYSTSKYNSDYNNRNTRSKGFDLSVGRLTLLLYF